MPHSAGMTFSSRIFAAFFSFLAWKDRRFLVISTKTMVISAKVQKNCRFYFSGKDFWAKLASAIGKKPGWRSNKLVKIGIKL